MLTIFTSVVYRQAGFPGFCGEEGVVFGSFELTSGGNPVLADRT